MRLLVLVAVALAAAICGALAVVHANDEAARSARRLVGLAALPATGLAAGLGMVTDAPAGAWLLAGAGSWAAGVLTTGALWPHQWRVAGDDLHFGLASGYAVAPVCGLGALAAAGAVQWHVGPLAGALLVAAAGAAVAAAMTAQARLRARLPVAGPLRYASALATLALAQVLIGACAS